MTIDDAGAKAEAIDRLFGNACTVEEELLGVHEALTRLWVAHTCRQGGEEVTKRASNLLYGTLLIAGKLGVDLEQGFEKRLVELEKESTG